MKNLKPKKALVSLLVLATLAFSSIGIIGVFVEIQEKIQQQMYKNYMEQIEELSTQIINTIHLEIENSIHLLETITESYKLDPDSFDESLEILKDIDKKGHFTSLGIMDSKGNCADLEGNSWSFDPQKFITNLSPLKSRHYYHISDIITSEKRKTKEILITIPIYKNKKLNGALFAYYPISEIEDEINLNISEEYHQYFQLIDTKGNYINKLNEKTTPTPSEVSLWSQMKNYKFLKKNTLERIQNDINQGRKGTFYFEDEKDGHYVVYEPLGIKKWYIFSIFTQKEIFSRADEYQKISKELLMHLIGYMIIILMITIAVATYIYKLIMTQSKDLQIKNKMFQMLANKTKDIFFEVHFESNEFILFNFSNGNEEIHVPLSNLSPEHMLKKDYIKEETLSYYKELYSKTFAKKNIENSIIQVKRDGVWKWFRINSVVFNSDNIIGILEDFTGEKEQEFEMQRISEKSKYDFLTGLYNRETFESEYNNFITSERANEFISALFILDLDNFKEINDKFGHKMGDTVLRETSNLLKKSLRKTDVLGRLGGDEFVVLIPNAPNLDALHSVAQKLNHVLTNKYSKDNVDITVSCSIGIAILKDGMNFKQAYEIADTALYQVKYNGRNSYFIK